MKPETLRYLEMLHLAIERERFLWINVLTGPSDMGGWRARRRSRRFGRYIAERDLTRARAAMRNA